MHKYLSNIFDRTSGEIVTFAASMVILLSILIFMITIFLLVRQYLFRSKASRQLRKSQHYNDLLLDCLFSDNQDITESCIIKGKKGKHLLFNSMIYLMQNFNGELSEKLRSLFFKLKLEKFLLKKLKSRNWWVVAGGLHESRIMGYQNALKYAEKHINSRKLELRVEAQISIIALKRLDPFEFLDRLKRPFSIWARINLYQEISQWNQKPDATTWLKSTNAGVLSFGLKVMGILNQQGTQTDLEPLINHGDDKIRAELINYAAILMDRDLWLKSAMKFKTETVVVRKKIGQTCGMLPDIPMSLLVNWFNWEKATIVKIELGRSMLIHGKAAGLKPGELNALRIVA
jgi:hypothetical protein